MQNKANDASKSDPIVPEKNIEAPKIRVTPLIFAPSPRVVAGCVLTILVVLLWVGGSVLSQFLLDDDNWNKPLLMTAFNTSLFTTFLVGFVFSPSWRQQGRKIVLDTSASFATDDSFGPVDGVDYEAAVPLLASDANAKSAPQKSQSDDGLVEISKLVAGHPVHKHGPEDKLSWQQHAILAAWYTPIWLLSSYTYNLSLCFECGTGTSVSVHTVISGTAALFALVWGHILIADARDSNAFNLLAVIISTSGAALITGVDVAPGSGNTWQGDAICAFAALTHGLNSVLLKKWVPDDSAVNMEMFFGFVGLWNTLMSVPCLAIVHYVGWEVFTGFPKAGLLIMVLNALLGTVISNLLWAKAVVLTSPLLVNVGCTMNVPLAFAADYLNPYATHYKFKWEYVVGAIMVLAAFLSVSVPEAIDKSRRGSLASSANTSENGDHVRHENFTIFWGGAHIDAFTDEGEAHDWQI